MARRGSTTELAALLASLDLSAYLPAAAPSPAAPKYSPVAVDAPAPASFAAVVAAPAPAREHKSS